LGLKPSDFNGLASDLILRLKSIFDANDLYGVCVIGLDIDFLIDLFYFMESEQKSEEEYELLEEVLSYYDNKNDFIIDYMYIRIKEGAYVGSRERVISTLNKLKDKLKVPL